MSDLKRYAARNILGHHYFSVTGSVPFQTLGVGPCLNIPIREHELNKTHMPCTTLTFLRSTRVQPRFCTKAYSRMAYDQQYFDAEIKDQYTQGQVASRVEQVFQACRSLFSTFPRGGGLLALHPMFLPVLLLTTYRTVVHFQTSHTLL